ncbi:MAG: L-threonylcarbamoyladenylate synthase [Chloroflexota bacterium]
MHQQFSTRVILVNPLAIDAQAIDEAAALLRDGQLVAFPTETVYGLGANALDAVAAARIFAAKDRPASDPLIVHIWSIEQLAQVAIEIPNLAHRLIEVFWPGPLTLILRRAERVPDIVSAGQPTVAVRMPAHPIAQALLRACELPIAAPSANRFAHSSPTTAQHVLDDLDGRLPLILDGGPTSIGLESTIVDLSSDRPRLVRPGGTTLDTLRQFIPDLEVTSRYAQPEAGAMPAPGMLLKHYSPRADLLLFDGPDEAVRATLIRRTHEALADGKRVGLLIADEDFPALSSLNVPTVSLGSLTDLPQVARRLYAGLRDLDATGVDLILARAYPSDGMGFAIRDRLIRAAEGKVVTVN